MKTGKQINVEIFDNFKTRYGSVDTKNLKSIYVVLSTWAEPKEELEKDDEVDSNDKQSHSVSLSS